MKTDFGKLVRDGIPSMIRAHGAVPVVRVLEDDEFVQELKKRLIEQAWNVHFAKQETMIEECADIFEVLTWMMRAQGIDPSEVFDVAEKRRKERGGFADRAFLIAVEEVATTEEVR